MPSRHDLTLPAVPSAFDAFDVFDIQALAALRAWHEGMSSRQAAQQYLPQQLPPGERASARAVIGRIRRALVRECRQRGREDLAPLFQVPAAQRVAKAPAVRAALAELQRSPLRAARLPQITDTVREWSQEIGSRACAALEAQGLRTLADLTVRIPRRRQWWRAVPGLGEVSARRIEGFFARNPELTERARLLLQRDAKTAGELVPLERMRLASELDGSRGAFRAPASECLLDAHNDLQALQAWISLNEAPATQRAYRKEAERLILWAVFERGKPLSSLNTEDAIAYRAFLRDPHPRTRWVGPARSRHSPEWKPFSGPLSSSSIAYTMSVLGALYRWLSAQRYVVGNPFAGIKVRGAGKRQALDAGRSFTQGEWALVRTIADGLEHSYGWGEAGAQRLRFMLDFSYATGLRASELVGVSLRQLRQDGEGNWWLHVVGKGHKAGQVAVPPLARQALERHLAQRGLPTSPHLWAPSTPVLGRIRWEGEGAHKGADEGQDETGGRDGISGARLWAIMKRFFRTAAQVLQPDHPMLADKLRQASPHWMRHTHASHALAQGADITSVRDNLRHASTATTSNYLHGEQSKRARQMAGIFSA